MLNLKRTILLLSFSICLVSRGLSQYNIQWQYRFGGNHEESFTDVKKTPDGGYILAGNSTSTDGIFSGNNGLEDLWVIKLNACLQVEWKKNYGGLGSDLADHINITADSGFIVIGSSNSTNGSFSGNHGDYDLWILKLDKFGTQQWQKIYGGPAFDIGHDIVQLPDHSYIAVGHIMGAGGNVTNHIGNTDAWLFRMDQSGNIIWEKTFGSPGADDAYNLVVADDGGYVFSGISSASGGNVPLHFGSGDVSVFKTDANGNLLWQKSFGGTDFEVSSSIVKTDDGDIVVSGYTKSTGMHVSGNHGNNDIWVVRIKPDGTLKWQRCIGGTNSDTGADLVRISNNRFFTTGLTQSIDFDAQSAQGMNVINSILDNDGNLVWSGCFGGSRFESGAVAIEMPDSGILVSGVSRSTDFHLSGIPFYGGFYDAWLFKLYKINTLVFDSTICYNGFFRGKQYKVDTVFHDSLKNICGLDSVFHQVNLKVLPDAILKEADTTVCYRDKFAGISISRDTSIIYRIQNALGCDSIIHTYNIRVNHPWVFAGNDTSIVRGTTAQLQAVSNGPVTWQSSSTLSCFSCLNPIASPLVNTTYRVDIVNGSCQATDWVTIKVIPDVLYIPTGFSPNNDGKNDEWRLTGYARDFNLRVFNRWGNCIFESANPQKGWDGRYRGVLQNAGVYIYLIEYTSFDHKRSKRTGSFILIR